MARKISSSKSLMNWIFKFYIFFEDWKKWLFNIKFDQLIPDEFIRLRKTGKGWSRLNNIKKNKLDLNLTNKFSKLYTRSYQVKNHYVRNMREFGNSLRPILAFIFGKKNSIMPMILFEHELTAGIHPLIYLTGFR